MLLKHGYFLAEKPDPVGGDGYGSRQDFIFRLGRAVATCFTDGGKNFFHNPVLEPFCAGQVRPHDETVHVRLGDDVKIDRRGLYPIR